jgi:hypothetical protein
MWLSFRQLSLIILTGLLTSYTVTGAIPTPIYAYTFKPPTLDIVDSAKDGEPEDGSCIPSGDHTSIQNALTGIGSEAVLCPDASFELSETVYFTADSQSIYTEGSPTDSTRAFLRVAHSNVVTAIESRNWSHLKLSNVIIDGNRPGFGAGLGALIEWGSAGTGNLVEHVRAYEPRGWSVLYIGEGDDHQCDSAVARYNELGPGGHAEYAIADGISLGCRNSIVEYNTIVDVTDGGIVIFQAPGSRIANNTIRAENRIMFYGISMEDYGPYDGDFTGTVVTGNVIDAAGAMIRRGIGMGPHVGCIPDDEAILRSRGAVVTHNTLMGDNMAYGFVVSGVEDWTLTGNVDLSTHLIPEEEADCFGEAVDPPSGFQYNPLTSSGTFQSEFEPAILGFTNEMWTFQTVVSESCLVELIGEARLDSIRSGILGPIWWALENSINGEFIGECVGIYEPPNISDLTGDVMVSVDSCTPFCVDLTLNNISSTDTASMERADFLMESFLVPCIGLPSYILPEEEVHCSIEEYVSFGFQVVNWYGFQPGSGGVGFTYPFDPVIVETEDQALSAPKSFVLSQNHPNPFNPSTTIDYIIPEGPALPVHLVIYDVRGRLTRILVDVDRLAGRYTVHWDGKDNHGNEVGSGIYLYRIEAGDFKSTRKMVIAR